MNLEEDVVNLSRDEVSRCLSASVPVVTDPFSPVRVVCHVVVSDSDWDFGKPQTFFFLSLSPENAKRM